MEVPLLSQKIMHHSLAFRLLPVATSIVVAILYYPTISHLFERWIKWDEGLSHGLIVVGLFLILQLRSGAWGAAQDKKALHYSTLLLLAGLSALWFLFHVVNLYIFEQLILLPILFVLLASIFGWRTSIKHSQLLMILIFSIPVWDQLNEPLVNLSSYIVGNMVRIIDMPAVIDGNSIFIPSGHIVIADGCSGLRYFVIALTLGYIISYLNHYSAPKTISVLVIAALIGLLANWLRIFILVVIGYQTEMQSSLMSDHEYFGWFLFALISFPAIYFAPIVKAAAQETSKNVSTSIDLWAPLLLLAVGPALNMLIDLKPVATTLKDILSHELQPITARQMPITIDAPSGAKTENALTAQKVYVQIDQYQRVAEADKLVPYIARLYDNQRWTAQHSAPDRLNNIHASLTIFRNKTTQKNVAQLQWFTIMGLTTDNVAVAKLLQIPALIAGNNHFMIATLQAECDVTNCNKAIAALQEAANTLSFNTKGN